MFETTIENDWESATTWAEQEAISEKIYNKFRNEFLTFINELKESGIAQALYNSSTPEETISIWEEYSAKNQELLARIDSWAKGRYEYFNTFDSFPLFKDDEEIDCILEAGLMIFSVNDECILSEEDINNDFIKKIVGLLEKSSNQLLRAAGYYIDCNGFESMNKENIYNFYSED